MDSFNVFVYCGGKCGSMTLFNTFINNGFETLHTHGNGYYKYITHPNADIFEVIENSCKKYETVYIIDSYRLPIERKVSSLFQNIEAYLPNYKQLSCEEIAEYFNTILLYDIEDYHPINEVLEQNNMPLFTQFDFEKRYNTISQDNKIFIKILFNDIDKWDKILSEIFQKNINIANENLTKDKEINDIYIKFKEYYKVPEKYITDYLLHDVEFKIYNTETEQHEYIEKWLKKSY